VSEPNPPAFVYLVEANGLYKIGRSSNPELRIKEIQTGNGNKVRLVCMALTAYASATERLLHKRLKGYRTSGEWFALSDSHVERVSAFLTLLDGGSCGSQRNLWRQP
jgi:hypothetical protein